MKVDAVLDMDSGIHGDAESRQPARRANWSTPSVTRLQAGLAETGLNSGYDGVEGTS